MRTILSASATTDAISLKAYYVGPNVNYDTQIPKTAILVKLISNNTEKVVYDWTYINGNIVTPENKAILNIQYQTYTTSVQINLIKKEAILFECHYHGDPVLINTEFDPKKLHARIVYNNGECENLHSYQYDISGKIVTKKGNNNYYTAIHHSGLKDEFVVFGYEEDETDKDFKIFQQNDNIEIDLTNAYYPLFYHDILDKIYVSTQRLNRFLTPGKYRLILPKNTGLNCKHASEWIVIKSLDNNVKITPIKYYHKEDVENG